MTMVIENAERHAMDLVNLLVDCGPLTSAQVCTKLGWSKGRFTTALRCARESLCPELELSIPYPTPATGWQFQVTTEWRPVEAGASYTVGQVESRLKGVLRDVKAVKPHLVKGSTEWRRANFLDKHLSHILGTLDEIGHG